MRFLIVAESSEYRLSLASMLRSRWPAAETDEWDPRRQGHPGRALEDGRYAAVLLDSRPAGEDGIRWVADLRRRNDPPPVLLITETGGERLARSVKEALRELFASIAI
jgi:DNA-binding response OmpR family regulator